MAEVRHKGHKLHYQTGVQTRRAVARDLGKRVMDDAGQSAPVLLRGISKPWYCTSGPGDAVNGASMCSPVSILIVATPAVGAWSSLKCIYLYSPLCVVGNVWMS